jgi:hypothetical protein
MRSFQKQMVARWIFQINMQSQNQALSLIAGLDFTSPKINLFFEQNVVITKILPQQLSKGHLAKA